MTKNEGGTVSVDALLYVYHSKCMQFNVLIIFLYYFKTLISVLMLRKITEQHWIESITDTL